MRGPGAGEDGTRRGHARFAACDAHEQAISVARPRRSTTSAINQRGILGMILLARRALKKTHPGFQEFDSLETRGIFNLAKISEEEARVAE